MKRAFKRLWRWLNIVGVDPEEWKPRQPGYGESLDGGQPRAKRPRREVGLGEREWMWRHREAGMN